MVTDEVVGMRGPETAVTGATPGINWGREEKSGGSFTLGILV